jgi:4-diphosphocytidyl-2-C-methyl-D-erythritol kinase
MVVFPNCKINIGLQVLDKRPDGYHNIETIFYPVPLKDAVEIIEAPGSVKGVEFTASGLAIEGNENNNLCIRAYDLLKNDFPHLPPIKMHLHKVIPMGAGLGGGSADGAFALRLINEKFALGLKSEQLLAYALHLGSDCPFFIINTASFASGRGEALEPIPTDLTQYQFLLINPGIHINTSKAFGALQHNRQYRSLKDLISEPVAGWKGKICNDFEHQAFMQFPEMAVLKDQLYAAGAVYASMSGSGSTIYGIFEQGPRPRLNMPPHYFFRWL